MPSDSPASSGRQSPQTINSGTTSSETTSSNHAESKTTKLSQNEVNEPVEKKTENSEAKEKIEKEDGVLSTKENADEIDKTLKEEDSSEENKGSPIVDNESELVSEILGGKKPTVVLEKELPTTPKSEGKSASQKGDSNINAKPVESNNETANNTGRPKRLVRKLVENKDKKDKEKDKSK